MVPPTRSVPTRWLARLLLFSRDVRRGPTSLVREPFALAPTGRSDRRFQDALRYRLYGPRQPRRGSLSHVDGRPGPETGRRKPRPSARQTVLLDPGRLADVAGPLVRPDRPSAASGSSRPCAAAGVPHALAFTTHTESLDLEDLTRGFRFSAEMARLAGQPLPTGCKMTDVPDHTRGLATVLAHAGIKFFHHGCNDNCTPADLPPLFWWEGPDGSRVLTMLSRTYGSDLCPPADWPYKTWICIWMTTTTKARPTKKWSRPCLPGPSGSCRACGSTSASLSTLPMPSSARSRTCRWSATTRPTRGSTGSGRCRSKRNWRMPRGRGLRPWNRSTRCCKPGACRAHPRHGRQRRL